MRGASRLVAVSGLSGAGKTTVIDHLSAAGFGERLYVGRFVLERIQSSHLMPNTESEKLMRLRLREELGPAAMAQLAAPAIRSTLAAGNSVLLDAILSVEEFEYYREHCGVVPQLMFLSASFETRAARLSTRSARPMSKDELRMRDRTDREMLGTEKLATLAQVAITNEDSKIALYAEVDKIDWFS